VSGVNCRRTTRRNASAIRSSRTMVLVLIMTCLSQAGDPTPKTPATSGSSSTSSSDAAGVGVGLYVVLLVGGLLGYFGYQYMQQQQQAI
jgi:cytochrome b5